MTCEIHHGRHQWLLLYFGCYLCICSVKCNMYDGFDTCSCPEATLITKQGSFPLNGTITEIKNTSGWPGAPRELSVEIIKSGFILTWKTPDDGSASFLQGFQVSIFSSESQIYPDTCYIQTGDAVILQSYRIQDAEFRLSCYLSDHSWSIVRVQIQPLPWPPAPRPLYQLTITFNSKGIQQPTSPPPSKGTVKLTVVTTGTTALKSNVYSTTSENNKEWNIVTVIIVIVSVIVSTAIIVLTTVLVRQKRRSFRLEEGN